MRKAIIGASLLISLITIILPCFLSARELDSSYLESHPLYKKYKFSIEAGTINIGIQPLYLPANLLAAVMKRDRLLKESLAQLEQRVVFYPFLKGDDVNIFFRGGHLQGGMVGDMPTLSIAVTRDVVVPVLIQLGYCSIIASRPLLIKQLKGKTIGYAFGSNAHFALLKALESDGLKESDVHMLSMEVTDMPTALASGKIHAFSAWEPIPSISLAHKPDAVVIHRNLNSGYSYFSREFSRLHPETLRLVIASQIRAMFWMMADGSNLRLACRWAKADAEKFTGKKLLIGIHKMVELALKDMLGICRVPLIPENYLEKNSLLFHEFKFLKTVKKIPANSQWQKVVDSFNKEFLIQVLAKPALYQLEKFIPTERDTNKDTNTDKDKETDKGKRKGGKG
ncbi:MAG: ABC transporter substrate-binding protein [bacterium]|nr:ABC transporter substrate-binding protein [bacterium]